MDIKKEKITAFLNRLKEIHKFYISCNNEQKIRVFEKSAFLVEELVKLGFDKGYIETLLVFGKDFLESERLIHNTEEIFGVKAQ